MDEHDDDLASEVIEGEEIESDEFDVEDDDDDARGVADGDESEDEAPSEDDSEI